MNDSNRVQSIDRAMSILECFSENRRELKLSEIAKMLDLNKSTVHGIITTLKYHRLIDQDELTQRYRLGIRFLEFGDVIINSMDIRNVAYPVIEDVCGRIEETVNLGMIDGSDVIYIEMKECSKSIRISSKIGLRIPAYATADGRIILCYMEKDKLAKTLPKRLKKFTVNTVTDKRKLMHRFSEMRENGYAIDNEEVVQGIKCVAAPIFDHKGDALYSLSAIGPSIRMTDDKIKDLKIIMKEAANEISRRIGYRG